MCAQVVTVNCARIIHGNQVSTNGVVHVIDRVISAAGNTIQDVIEVDDDLATLLVSGILCCYFDTFSIQQARRWRLCFSSMT